MSPAVAVLVALAALLFAAGATWMFIRESSGLTAWGLGVMAVMGLVALIDTIVTRVELREDGIDVRTLGSHRRYARDEIEGASEEKGVPAALRLRGGRRVRMPENIGSGFGNSVRAWLGADPAGADPAGADPDRV